jgi:hypothetical protein
MVVSAASEMLRSWRYWGEKDTQGGGFAPQRQRLLRWPEGNAGEAAFHWRRLSGSLDIC